MLREKMVKNQIEGRGIKSPRVLAAMRKVERHRFVPKELVRQAYDDGPLPIGEGQTISQPYIVAFRTDALELQPTDKVLENGTGSGYQAAILGELFAEVYTIEIFETLANRSANLLKEIGYKNIRVLAGDGYVGWPEQAPFDAIIVTCSPTEIPQPLQDQLKEGGRMIIPVGDYPGQELVVVRKEKGKIRRERVLSVLFVPMIDKEGKKY